ncbi:DUF4352 domain-containing protein [Sutcliffiella horikoshii]|uniref:DUF4352 domain-containing protein n=1 Tax=Sutcliffiella horikoshii TaxID=79883 RepID=UPI00384F8080
MLKNIKLILGMVIFVGILAACGSEESSKKVDAPKEGASAGNSEESEANLEDIDWENMSESDWEDINLSKKQFEQLLEEMTTPDESGEIIYSEAKMEDDTNIVITLNNSDGDTLENSMIAPFTDAIIRQFYKHSAFFNNEEPTIKVVDLSGFVVIENNEELEFDESGETAGGEDLGTFAVGDKVDVAGYVITINGVSLTEERNEYADENPEEVLALEITLQNSTQEEIYFNAYELELYDANGTLMEVYPLDNFDATLQPGKNSSGTVFFGVSGDGPYELFYTEWISGTKAMWNVSPQ